MADTSWVGLPMSYQTEAVPVPFCCPEKRCWEVVAMRGTSVLRLTWVDLVCVMMSCLLKLQLMLVVQLDTNLLALDQLALASTWD